MEEYFLRTMAAPHQARKLSKTAVFLLRQYLLDEELLHDIDLALCEACFNVVMHAYPDGRPGDVEITVRLEPEGFVELRVADWGRGLDWERVRFENPGTSAESGRGLFILRKLADALEYGSAEGKNQVVIRKNIGSSAWKNSASIP
ncbi:MAG: ATP-binding protein [Desulfocurvibacter africanus]